MTLPHESQSLRELAEKSLAGRKADIPYKEYAPLRDAYRNAVSDETTILQLIARLEASERDGAIHSLAVDLVQPAIDVLGQDLIAMTERALAAEKDAARYRWLRNSANDTLSTAPAVCNCTPEDDQDRFFFGEQLDAAIDAQIAARKE